MRTRAGACSGVPGGRGRARLYLRADIERLKARHDARAGHGLVAAEALRWASRCSSRRSPRSARAGPSTGQGGAVALALDDVSPFFEAVAELLLDRRAAGGVALTAARPAERPPGLLAALLPEGAPPSVALAPAGARARRARRDPPRGRALGRRAAIRN